MNELAKEDPGPGMILPITLVPAVLVVLVSWPSETLLPGVALPLLCLTRQIPVQER